MYIVIKHHPVHDINCDNNQIVSGALAPTAIAGFGHNIVRILKNKFGVPFIHSGTASVVHEFEVAEGIPKTPVYEENKTKALETIPSIIGHGVFSFIIKVDFKGVSPSKAYGLREQIQNDVTKMIHGLKFQGGSIFPSEENASSVSIHLTDDALKSELASLKNGFVLVDRYDVLENEVSSDNDPLDVVLNNIEIVDVLETNSDGKKETRRSRKSSGWIVPIAIGYQAIVEPVHGVTKRYSRDDYPHVFAESLTGIGEYVSLNKELIENEKILSRSFWCHQSRPESHTYFVSTRNHNSEI